MAAQSSFVEIVVANSAQFLNQPGDGGEKRASPARKVTQDASNSTISPEERSPPS
jgi:hypothetical protein